MLRLDQLREHSRRGCRAWLVVAACVGVSVDNKGGCGSAVGMIWWFWSGARRTKTTRSCSSPHVSVQDALHRWVRRLVRLDGVLMEHGIRDSSIPDGEVEGTEGT